MLTLSSALMCYQASVSELWSLETIGIMDSAEVKCKEERERETQQHFQNTVSRGGDGRYTVKLPWISTAPPIPSNRQIAMKRLESTTRKLAAVGMINTYDQMFSDWLAEGIIEVVDQIDIGSEVGRVHYLPHHAVIKPQSLTTPVRPVFDASCKVSRNPSLNDCLEKGPNLLELIPSILLRFREKKIGVIADIRKAFEMIYVSPSDRNYLRFLWWEDIEQKIVQELRHKRVVFGVNCSPFLLGAVIEKHCKDVAPEDAEIAAILLKSMYVDNSVMSVDSVQDLEEYREKSTSILASAMMELRQWEWSTVEGTGIGTTTVCGLVHDSVAIPQELTGVLGLKWNKIQDCLGVDIPSDEVPEKVTKRLVLSLVQKFFDPMGYLCPTTLVPKLLLQAACGKNIGWDSEVEENLSKEFRIWWNDSPQLKKIHIPRHAFGNSRTAENLQFHTFCDASSKAYAAVVFVRVDEGGVVRVHLLQAKARVSPLKKITIPRLELLGCLIGSRLRSSVIKALSMENIESYFCSDSSTALAWIRRNDEWGTFVGNRVKEICSLTSQSQWRFVPGVMNPADLPSRGCTPSQLVKSRWWEGPEWLTKPQHEWPSPQVEYDEEEVRREVKKCVTTRMQVGEAEIPWYLTRYSSYTSNLRLFAWVIRFVDKCRKRHQDQEVSGFHRAGVKKWDLSQKEVDRAERKWFLRTQQDAFSKEKSAVIAGLKTEKDEDGVIRVKTKLLFRQDTEYFRRPVLLPNSHPLVEQLIAEVHRSNGHGGAQFLMGRLREKCWIIQGRRAVRSFISKCVVCRRYMSKSYIVQPAPLPENRVKTAAVFQVVGIDLAGPMYLEDQSKTWMVIFTCAIYRCIHLELVDSLSTEAFLLALSRFISRRGRPSTIYSDNGTNFVGADHIMKNMDWDRITARTRVQRIQ
ncbi:hypothetical protein Fcan01_10291 [Folsomia candida]|uniref:Integrase catalytic domain-containing protein n=2 Tax=Folsomia candida TaxID=158441 RepID=A0A226EDH2_FOLCA|nr:hypothetical protein Fcan01_10291 [Folsomia candida]